MVMTQNGWGDLPEDQQERLELCEMRCGPMLMDSADRIIHSRESIRTSRLRLERRHR